MNKRRIYPAIVSLLLLALAFHAEADNAKKPPLISSDLNGVDLQFLTSASQQGVLQAALGELATTHAQSADVKAFGQTLAREQAMQNEQIRLLAIKKGLALPDNLNPGKNPATTKLAKLQGLKFDKAYMDEMFQQEQSYVAIFEQGSQSHDPDIKSFIDSVLPTLKRHLAFLKGTTPTATAPAPAATATPRFRVDVSPSPAN